MRAKGSLSDLNDLQCCVCAEYVPRRSIKWGKNLSKSSEAALRPDDGKDDRVSWKFTIVSANILEWYFVFLAYRLLVLSRDYLNHLQRSTEETTAKVCWKTFWDFVIIVSAKLSSKLGCYVRLVRAWNCRWCAPKSVGKCWAGSEK